MQIHQHDISKGDKMAILKVRRFSQITLPSKIRRKFKLSEGDYLEVEEVKQGILLKPVSVVEKELAWEKVFKAMEGIKEKKPSKKSLKAKEQEIARIVKESRKKK